MPQVKNIDQIASKWKTVTPGRATQYDEGVRNPKKDWATATAASAAIHKEATLKALNDNRYEKGVTKAGTSAWQEGAIKKGTVRWGEGVSLGEEKYRTNMAPYIDVIARTSLPPRFPSGHPNNIQRAAEMAKALHEKKVSGT